MNNYIKAKQVVSLLTLKEKIGQISQIVNGYEIFDIDKNKNIILKDSFKNVVATYGGIGSITALIRSDPWTKRNYDNGITIDLREKIVNVIQDYLIKNTRLKLPALIDIEASHGVMGLDSVIYPTGLASAASFNPSLYGMMMCEIGKEIELSGNNIAFVTLIDLCRDPRWGRSEECLGEDSVLASKFVTYAVENLNKSNILVCAKHVVSAGICDGGLNGGDVLTNFNRLDEIECATLKASINAGVDMLMATYNSFDGVPIHTNYDLLTDLIKNKYGFDGIIISDGAGILSTSCELNIDRKSAAIMAIKAGIDLSLCDNDCFTILEEAVLNNELDICYIDRACIKIIEKKIKLGLLDGYVPFKEGQTKAFIEDGHCQKIAYEMAKESITLIKNDGVLPLSRDNKIALLGENANDIYHLLGDYTPFQKDETKGSIYSELLVNFKNIRYADGWRFDNCNNFKKAIDIATNSDVIIYCLGGTSKRQTESKFLFTGANDKPSQYIDCGEGVSLANLEVPPQQINLLHELKKLNKPIISIVMCGRAYVLNKISELSNAVIIAYYPGQCGGTAISDILCGKVNPSGKLPITLPSSSGALPVCHDFYARPCKGYIDIKNPIYLPFGYGLSYSKFKYQNLKITYQNGDIDIKFNIFNDSLIDGKDVALLFISPLGDIIKHRQNQLYDFQKIEILSKKVVTINFVIKNAIKLFKQPICPKFQIAIGPLGHEVLKQTLELNKQID